jgi:hypothetical protein
VHVAAHPELGVRNSQPEGIGRVSVLGPLVAWNNLGRNIVFADRRFRPLAVFGTTAYPHDDELSQYDLDIHAVLVLEDEDLVVTLNHLGTVHGFATSDLSRTPAERALTPVLSTTWAADLERTVAVGNRLVSSRPGSDPGGGLLVSEPVRGRGRRNDGPDGRMDGPPDGGGGERRGLAGEPALEGWGRVTALDTFRLGADLMLAVGGEGRVALVDTRDGHLGRTRRAVEVPLRAAAFAWDGARLWVAGSALTAAPTDDYRWEDLRGGRYAALDPVRGRTVCAGPLPEDVAWGNGGEAVVMAGGRLVVIGRTGRLRVLTDPSTGSFTSGEPLAEASLGIAHAAAVGDRVLCGFNRGGYRLHAWRVPPRPGRA